MLAAAGTLMPVYTYQSSGTASVGIDLGCKEAATDSNGDGVTGRQYRKLERPLGIAQRANKQQRAKANHAKIHNRRRMTCINTVAS